MKRIVIAALAAACLASPSLADNRTELTVDEFFEGIKANRQMSGIYLAGVLDGLKQANAFVRVQGGKRVYCAPDSTSITSPQALTILAKYATANPKISELRLGAGLAAAFSNAFPCR